MLCVHRSTPDSKNHRFTGAILLVIDDSVQFISCRDDFWYLNLYIYYSAVTSPLEIQIHDMFDQMLSGSVAHVECLS